MSSERSSLANRLATATNAGIKPTPAQMARRCSRPIGSASTSLATTKGGGPANGPRSNTTTPLILVPYRLAVIYLSTYVRLDIGARLRRCRATVRAGVDATVVYNRCEPDTTHI